MSIGSIVGGIVGGVIGFFAGGGPVGAAYGFAIGAGLGAVLDPIKGPTLPGPKLVDNAVQTAGYGSMIPRVYGRIAMAGNVVWLENNKLKATIRKKKQGGKGGGSVTTTSVSYSATFALMICEGPIKGISKIWCSDKLIYNATSSNPGALTQTAANGARMRFYLGTDDQLPDPRYQAAVGVGNAPAFRGEAYIVFEDFQLADYSNTLQAAQFKVEVMSDWDEQASALLRQNLSSVGDSQGSWGAGQTALGNYGEWLFSAFPSVAGIGVGVHEKYSIFSSGLDKITSEQLSPYDSLVSNTAMAAYTGPFPYGACTVEAGATGLQSRVRRWFRAGQSFYRLPFSTNSTSAIFAPHSGFVFNGDLYCTDQHPDTGVWYLNQIKPDPDAFATSFYTEPAQLAAQIDITPYSQRQIFLAGGMLCFRTTGNTFRRYGLSGLNFIDEITVPGAAIGASPAMEDGDYVYVVSASSLQGTSPTAANCWKFKNTFTEPAVAFSLTTTYPPGTTDLNTRIINRFTVRDGMLGALYHVPANVYRNVFKLNSFFPATVDLGTVVKTEMLRSGLIDEAEIDTALLTKEIRGYKVQSGSVRSAIEPLQAAFPFDVIQSGYTIKTIPRGIGVADSVQFGDIIPSGNALTGDCLDESREMDSQLPVKTIVKYLDASREYSISEQYAERINTAAVNRVDLELPLVLTATEAAGMAEVLNNLPWIERSEFAFALPPSFLHLEPADVITLSTPWQEYNLRIIEINYRQDGTLAVKARSNLSGLYVSEALGGDGLVVPDDDVAEPGPSFSVLLDVPVIDESSQNQSGFGVAMTGVTEDWPGGFELKSADAGANFDIFSTHTVAATIGTCGPAMPIRSGALVDLGSTLTVRLLQGELSSVTEAQMFGGSNLAAYGRDGRWEIIRFQNAALNPDGSYTLNTFWRGDFGTERYTGTHLEGDQFVLLEPDIVQFVPVNVALIGAAQTYREVTIGADIDSDDDGTFTYQGVNLECYSPVHARADRDASGNMTITWQRRTRIGGQWRDLVDVPIGEPTLQFEIDIMSGFVVRRTFATTLETVVYTAAQQVTDFSAVQPSVLIRVYQISPTVGRGYPLEVTV